MNTRARLRGKIALCAATAAALALWWLLPAHPGRPQTIQAPPAAAAPSARIAADGEMVLLDALGGPIHALAGDGDLVFAALGLKLAVFDLSAPDAPRLLGTTDPLPYPGRAVAVDGPWVFVADDYAGVVVVDVGDPSQPRVVAAVDTPGRAVDVAVAAGHAGLAVVADSLGGLRVLDVRDPVKPREVGHVAPGWSALGVAVSGDRAFVAAAERGLRVFDISRQAHPRDIGGYEHMPAEWRFERVTFADGIALVGAVQEVFPRLVTLDVSDPDETRWLGAIGMPGVEMVVADGLAVSVAELTSDTDGYDVRPRPLRSGRLTVTDVRDPAAMTHLADVEVDAAATALAWADGRLVTGGTEGLRVLDTGDPSTPRVIGAHDVLGPAEDLSVSGDLLLVADGPDGLRIVDASAPANLRQRGTLREVGDTVGVAVDVTGDDGRAYLASQPTGLHLVAIDQPDAPQALGSLHTTDFAVDLAVAGGHAYLAEASFTVAGQTGPPAALRVIDVADPAHPRAVGLSAFAEPYPLLRVTVNAGRAYVGFNTARLPYAPSDWRPTGLRVVDVSVPDAPVEITTQDWGAAPRAVALMGDRIVVGETPRRVVRFEDLRDGFGLSVFDLVTDAAPDRQFTEIPGTVIEDVAVSGHLAFVATHDDGLRVLDLTDPGQPRHLARWLTPGALTAVAASGARAFALDGRAGLLAFEWRGSAGASSAADNAVVVSGDGARYDAVRLHHGVRPRDAERLTDEDGPNAVFLSWVANVHSTDLPRPPIEVVGQAGEDARAVVTDGCTAYLGYTTDDAWIEAWDLCEMTRPALLGRSNTVPGVVEGMAYADGYLSVTLGWRGGLVVFDVRDPSRMLAVGQWNEDPRPPGSHPRDVAIAADHAVLADTAAVRVLDITDPTRPVVVGEVAAPAMGVAVAGDVVYVAAADEGLNVVDIGDPADPRIVATLETPGRAENVAVDGHHAYVADGRASCNPIRCRTS